MPLFSEGHWFLTRSADNLGGTDVLVQPLDQRSSVAPCLRHTTESSSARDATGGGPSATGDHRRHAQQLDPGVVLRVATRGGPQTVAFDCEALRPGAHHFASQARAGAIVVNGPSEALELVTRHAVVAGRGVEPFCRDRCEETRLHSWHLVQQPIRTCLV